MEILMRAIMTAAAATLALAACTKVGGGIPPSGEELAAADQAKCASYGYLVDQPEHEACRMMLDRQRAEADIEMRTGVMANPGAGPADAVPLAAPPLPPPLPGAPPVTVR
jgi:hypothetical protein